MSQDELKVFILFSVAGSFMTLYEKPMTKSASKIYRAMKSQLQKMYKSRPKEYLVLQDKFNKVWKDHLGIESGTLEIMNLTLTTLTYDVRISSKYGISDKTVTKFSTLQKDDVIADVEVRSNKTVKILVDTLYKEFGLEPKLSLKERQNKKVRK